MVTTPTREQLRALAACEALLDAPGFSPGHWEDMVRGTDGTLQMPWYEPSPELLALVAAVTGSGIELDRQWMDWAASPHGKRLIDDLGLVAGASADDVVSLLTVCIRGDRFNEGMLADAVENGVLRAILRRAAVLAGPGESRA